MSQALYLDDRKKGMCKGHNNILQRFLFCNCFVLNVFVSKAGQQIRMVNIKRLLKSIFCLVYYILAGNYYINVSNNRK